MQIELSREQELVSRFLLEASGPAQIRAVADAVGLDQSIVSAIALEWKESGWTQIRETTREALVPGAQFQDACELGLPERRLLSAFESRTEIPMREVSQIASRLNVQAGDALKYGTRKGWFRIEKGLLRVVRNAEEGKDEDEKALELIRCESASYLDEMAGLGVDPERLGQIIKNRGSILKPRERTIRLVVLTDAGRTSLRDAKVTSARSQLTSEEIASGAWRSVTLKPFDVTLKAEESFPAKTHPLRRVLEETRRAFLEMGFTEIVSPQVESAFWNFDALFQPQDHPAREMQDTFYLEHPSECRLPDDALVGRVKSTHEDGGQTGSKGWGYRWELSRARKTVLRTHTTACTVRALAAHPQPPLKVFCVGKNYRNEAISYKHLPEFFQVDGIVVDEKASFAALLSILREFYRKLGFEKVVFKPGFFPYTEPSAEVFGWMPENRTWIELGGSGVFRPEVTEPLGCKWPVLAWGQGLERLAMLRYGLKDIRMLYRSELDWLRRVPLCR